MTLVNIQIYEFMFPLQFTTKTFSNNGEKIIRNFFWAPLWGTHTSCQFVILPGFSPVQGVLKWKLWQLMSVKIHTSSSHILKTVRSFIDKEKKILKFFFYDTTKSNEPKQYIMLFRRFITYYFLSTIWRQ